MESMMGGSPGGDGDCVGDCLHHNRCLRGKAAIAGSVKFPAYTAFAARAAIAAVAAWLVAVAAWWWWEWWEWWEWRLMRGSKTLFTTSNGYMGGTVATRRRFMGAAFYRRQIERPAPPRTALDNRRAHSTVHRSSFDTGITPTTIE